MATVRINDFSCYVSGVVSSRYNHVAPPTFVASDSVLLAAATGENLAVLDPSD
jgi:hypothetical protein